jgi:hypothetical protein
MSVEEKVCVRVLSSMISFAAGEIAKFDNDFKSKLAGIDEVLQWKIGDDIATYTVIKNQEIIGYDGIADNPTVTFTIEDVGDALKMLTGQVDAGDLLKIVKFSDADKAAKLAFITETVAKYAEGLTGG